jgi:hypothetical protein
MKLLADVDSLLLLISCQNSGHKFGGDMLHAQFGNQTLLACPVTNSDLFSKVLSGATSILMNEMLKFRYTVRRCEAGAYLCAVHSQWMSDQP